MFRKIKSLQVSENVINIFQNDEQISSILFGISGLIESYQNGREHGHVVWAIRNEKKPVNIAYYICQDRRSDQICIYSGEYQMQSISDDAYKNPKYFSFNEFQEAAYWLANDILKQFN